MPGKSRASKKPRPCSTSFARARSRARGIAPFGKRERGFGSLESHAMSFGSGGGPRHRDKVAQTGTDSGHTFAGLARFSRNGSCYDSHIARNAYSLEEDEMTGWTIGQTEAGRYLLLAILLLAIPLACKSGSSPNVDGATDVPQASGGQPSSGGISGDSGTQGSGGAPGLGGSQGNGGSQVSGGVLGTGGSGTAGTTSSGGRPGGTMGSGGLSAFGGTTSSGGIATTGGAISTGGSTNTGGSAGAGGTPIIDASAVDAATYRCSDTESCTVGVSICYSSITVGGLGGSGVMPSRYYSCLTVPAACGAQPTCDCVCKNICPMPALCSCYGSPANSVNCQRGS